MTSLKTRLKDQRVWRAGGAVICLFLLALVVAFPRVVLPVLALLCGSLFFLYGLKSYASVAVIMLSTSGANGNGNGHDGSRKGLVNRLRKGNSHHPNGGHGNGKPFKLPADKQPFISIQLPMYNEDRVVDRLLSACTQLDYENYEVLVADDSSDQTLHSLERWAKHPKVRVSHRINRSGFKGAALKHASEVMNPKAQFVAVFDADFIPPPDILDQFLSYFYGVGSSDGNDLNLIDESLAVVQGYQWHVLNASENWITRAIRAEFAGSYVIERSTQELTGGMKMISGSVFMIRADVLRQHKWGTSITEDWELTLRLYLDGYKVLYTPFIQAPAECVSDFKQLTRQRMRWAEGHTFNVKRFFLPVMRSTKLSLREKLEFIYYAPYYLTSVLFMVGTAAWLISELILRVALPFWSEAFGWSLVFTNSAALILMNLAGLFQERGVRRSWAGLFSFALLTFLLVPYQAYAALKGLLEPHEGGWHRTQKSGVVTDVIKRIGLGRRMPKLMPKKKKGGFDLGKRLPAVARLSRLIPQPVRTVAAQVGVGLMASGLLGGLLILGLLSKSVNLASAAPDSFYLHSTAASGIGPAGETMSATVGSDGSTRVFNTAGQDAYWYVDQTWPTGNDDATIASGSYTANLYFDELPAPGSPQSEAASVDITVYAHITATDGSGATLITSASTTVTAGTSNPLALNLGSGSQQTFTASEPRLLRLWVEVTGVNGGGSFTLAYGSAADPSSLDTPAVTVADPTLVRLAGAIFIPPLTSLVVKRPRLALRLVSVVASLLLVLGILSQNVMIATAAPDVFYLHANTTSGITPAGEYTNTTLGAGSAAKTFNTAGQNAYWYVDQTWPTGNDNGGIAAGTYTLNLNFCELPPAWYNASWLDRKRITIDRTKVSAALTSFPVLINLGSDTELAANAQDDGDDILFTSSDGTTKLSHEIETFNGTTGELLAWVKVPSLSSTCDTTIYMYYANAAAANQQDVPNTWDASFSAVWHLKENPTAPAPQFLDSTSNPNDGTALPAGLEPSQVAGKINGSLQFDDINERRAQVADSATLDLPTNITASAWVKTTDTVNDSAVMVAKWGTPGNRNYWLGKLNGTSIAFYVDNTQSVTATLSLINDGAWHHVVGVADAANSLLRIYVDGTQRNTAAYDGTSETGTGLHYIGASPDSIDQEWNGGIDETRVSGTPRSAAWIATEYNNQSSPSTFYSLGAQGTNTTTNVQIVVTVSHTAPDGSGATTIVSSTTTAIDSTTTGPLALNIGSGALQTFTSADPRRLRVQVNVTAINGDGLFALAYDSAADPSSLDTPVVTVPEWGAAILFVAPLVPFLMSYVWKRRRRAAQLASVMLAAIMAIGGLAGTVVEVTAAPDTHYLHPTATSGITPAGEYMNTTVGSGGSTKAFNTASQDAYWYVDATWPTGSGDASIVAGAYTLNMYFANRPGAGSGDYPAVATTNTSVTTTASMSHSVSLPSGIQSGNLLIVLFNSNSASAVNQPTGWTEFISRISGSYISKGYYRKADGTEGSTLTITTTANTSSVHVSYRITGAADPAVRAPEQANVGIGGSATTIDPPLLTPTGGPKDFLWIAVGFHNSASSGAVNAAPTNYGNLLASTVSGTVGIGSAERVVNASSEDPGTIGVSASVGRRGGATIAVHPAASVDIQVTVSHTASDGSGATTIVTSSTTTINASTADPYALSIGSGSAQTFTSASPRRLRVLVNVVSVNSGGDFTLDYDGTCVSGKCSNLDTPVVTVPEYGLVFLPIALLIPVAVPLLKKRGTRPTQPEQKVGKETSDGQ